MYNSIQPRKRILFDLLQYFLLLITVPPASTTNALPLRYIKANINIIVMQGVNYETDDHVMVCPFQLLRAIISYRSHAENSPYILVKSCFHRLGYLEKASVIWRSKRYQNCGKERGFDTR